MRSPGRLWRPGGQDSAVPVGTRGNHAEGRLRGLMGWMRRRRSPSLFHLDGLSESLEPAPLSLEPLDLLEPLISQSLVLSPRSTQCRLEPRLLAQDPGQGALEREELLCPLLTLLLQPTEFGPNALDSVSKSGSSWTPLDWGCTSEIATCSPGWIGDCGRPAGNKASREWPLRWPGEGILPRSSRWTVRAASARGLRQTVCGLRPGLGRLGTPDRRTCRRRRGRSIPPARADPSRSRDTQS